MNSINLWAEARAALLRSEPQSGGQGAGATLIEAGGETLSCHLAAIRGALGQPGWLTLVAPPTRQVISPLVADGVDPNRLLWVHRGATMDAVWAAEQALIARRSALVICWVHQLDERDRRRLLLAARRSGGTVLVLSAALVGGGAVIHGAVGVSPSMVVNHLH